MRPAITVTVIARDEAANIGRCVGSVRAWAQEVIVVDSGSRDATRDIARAGGATVIEEAWRGYGAQKNLAAERAAHDWILSLDADEEPTPELLRAVDAAAAGDGGVGRLDPARVYGFRRVTQFCGQWIRHGAWGRDRVWRLYHRARYRWDERPVHESLAPAAPRADVPAPRLLDGELLHYSYPDVASFERKREPYLALSVEALRERGARPSALHRRAAPAWRAFRGYVLQGGWRDGAAGRYLAASDYRMVREKYARLEAAYRAEECDGGPRTGEDAPS